MKNKENQIEVPQSEPVRRFFFVCTAGINRYNNMQFNSFDIKKDDGKYPTYRECSEKSDSYFPGQHNITLLSISEIPAADWEHFSS